MLALDDFEGVYSTIQSIRMYHTDILDDVEFIVIDNSPYSADGIQTKKFMERNLNNVANRYIAYDLRRATCLKQKIYDYAETPYILYIEPRTMFISGVLRKLIDFFDQGKDGGNILHGPLIDADLGSSFTHFVEAEYWEDASCGKFESDPRAADPEADPFEIKNMFLGAFACRKDCWIKIPPAFIGNSMKAEDTYIHAKARQLGKTSLCLPFFRWTYRWNKIYGIRYANSVELLVRNNIVAYEKLGLNTENIKEFVKKIYPENKFNEILPLVKEEIEKFDKIETQALAQIQTQPVNPTPA